MNDDFARTIATELRTKWLGREILHLPTTTSTNDVAKQAAVAGSPEGLVVLADEQTRGRGRLGRSWHAPVGGSILMSLLLRPTLPPLHIFSLTMLTGSAIVAALERLTGLRCDLKWPNDVVIDGKKLGGILTEASLTSDGIEFAVVGVGLNVNVDFAGEPALADTATSLSIQLGRPLARVPLIQGILEEFEKRYEAAQRDEYSAVLEEWRARLVTLGKQVIVTDGQWRETGLAYSVDLDGTLLLRRDDGSVVHVVTGDVSLRETTANG